MNLTQQLDVSAASAIADLSERSFHHPPTAREIAGSLFTELQPAVVRGDPSVGVVATVGEAGSLRFIAVDPAHRGRGHGHTLIELAEDDLRAAPGEGPVHVTTGADPPYFLFPGVESDQTALLCLLERHHYNRAEANFNMDVDLTRLPDAPDGPVTATSDERDEVAAFVRDQWSNWEGEALRALDKGTLLIERDDDGIVGFCAYDVNRGGLLGPIAVRLSLMGKGRGVGLLLAGFAAMRASGRTTAEVCWVGPILPYARAGGRVGRTFFVYRKDLHR